MSANKIPKELSLENYAPNLDSIKTPSNSVNVVALLYQHKSPKKTRGHDWSISLNIRDDSLDVDEFIIVNMFRSNFSRDICDALSLSSNVKTAIIIYGAHAQRYRDKMQLVCWKGESKFALVTLSQNTKSNIHVVYSEFSGLEYSTILNSNAIWLEKIRCLLGYFTNQSSPKPQIETSANFESQNDRTALISCSAIAHRRGKSKRKLLKLSQLVPPFEARGGSSQANAGSGVQNIIEPPTAYFDIVARIKSIPDTLYSPCDIQLEDGTQNDFIEEKMYLNCSIWDEHADHLQQFQLGDVIFIENLRLNFYGGSFEAKLHGTMQKKRHIHKVETNTLEYREIMERLEENDNSNSNNKKRSLGNDGQDMSSISSDTKKAKLRDYTLIEDLFDSNVLREDEVELEGRLVNIRAKIIDISPNIVEKVGISIFDKAEKFFDLENSPAHNFSSQKSLNRKSDNIQSKKRFTEFGLLLQDDTGNFPVICVYDSMSNKLQGKVDNDLSIISSPNSKNDFKNLLDLVGKVWDLELCLFKYEGRVMARYCDHRNVV